MTLTYKNLSKDTILSINRNINYANCKPYFGPGNNVEINLELTIDAQHVAAQADIFAREILRQRSNFDFKRFLGQYQDDWLRLLHETYMYDRAKNIYYGINSINMFKAPDNSYSFPGNVLLRKFLSDNSYIYQVTAESQPMTLYVTIKHSGDYKKLLQPLFDIVPDIKEGMSDIPNVYSYVNTQYEAVLFGLYNARLYLAKKGNKDMQSNENTENGKKTKSDLFQIVRMDDSTTEGFALAESNPLTNSFLSENGKSFYFVLPKDKTATEALRNNESLFLSRALGFRRQQFSIDGNPCYLVANRNPDCDPFTRDDVYSVTGLKSELVPYSMEQMEVYLSVNSYKSYNGNGFKVEYGGGEGTDRSTP